MADASDSCAADLHPHIYRQLADAAQYLCQDRAAEPRDADQGHKAVRQLFSLAAERDAPAHIRDEIRFGADAGDGRGAEV